MSLLNKLAISILKFYKGFISPLLPPVCRFTPSCSEYAMESYRIHGFARATYLTITRLLRCNPLFKGGLDPVPLKKNYKEL
jgi:putative membrane protein insertion efficiency factor